jgi:hypothetical protein
MNKIKIEGQSIFGFIVLLVGLVMLLNGLDIISADISIAKYWPIILIVLGVVKIINYDESSFWGGILLIIGVYFLLSNLDVAWVQNIRFTSVFWPFVVILIGLSLVFPKKSH